MTPDDVVHIGQEAMTLAVLLAAPLLLSALAAGLLIGMFQAATQIQDMTLSFIPKLLVFVIALGVAGPWMLRLMMDFTISIFKSVPALSG
ncbi:MAG TPA: flagellar biosynthetic protein FliQ [Spongiibacteraceae bacterium]|nr:flagellar biosynthetic protein FliQ [Spongiibacteraceae bacterium]HCS27713.1 flagellar biosynthetic protein FliQ [Spongiibacteraceae bacterium]|tara:strand:+ start:2758 stop:3027 length:270 start_codon:yes stop_codon:yes gene_type:complete